MMKYNILYVIDNLEYGGGERGFGQIIFRLNKNGYNIYVASNPGGEFAKKLFEIGVNPRIIKFESKYNFINYLKLAQIIKKEGIHIVHSQGLRAEMNS